MSEYDHEPIRGLPGELPADEHIIWQSSPDWKHLARAALHIRLSALYFGAIAIWAVSRGDMNTATAVAVLGVVVVSLFTLFACRHPMDFDGQPLIEESLTVRHASGRLTREMAAVRRVFVVLSASSREVASRWA